MNSKFGIAVIVVGFLVFTVGTARPAHAAPPTNACSLLTPAQVSAVLGVPLRPPVEPIKNACLWLQAGSAAPGKGKGAMLTILVTLGPKLTPIDRFNNAKKGGKFRGTPKPVSGIGDDAVYSMESTGGVQLYVKKGTFIFKVRVTGFPPQETQDKEKTLALAILAKV